MKRPALLTLCATALALGGCGDDSLSGLPTARRGDLEVTLTLRGTFRPVREVSIRSPRGGEIKWMAPNGSRVRKGEVVLELVATELEGQVRDRRADLEIREAELRETEQEVAKLDREATLASSAAKLSRELAEARRAELAARPTDRELSDATTAAELARALLAAAREAVGLLKDLVKSGYAPEDDLRRAELEVLAAQANLAAAEARGQAVKAGPTASERQAAEIELQSAKLTEQAAERNVLISREAGQTKLLRFQRRLEREREALAESERNLAQAVVRSPGDGVVLYAPRPWGGTWQVGAQVWPGASVLSIPDLRRLKVVIQVPAERVREIELGERVPARVTSAALPGRVFPGRLVRVSAMGRDEFEDLDPATSGKLGRAERQVFEAEVELDENDARLRPGLSARAELVLRRLTGVVVVPGSALAVREGSGGAAVVYVRTARGFEERSVRVLERNAYDAAVEGLVAPGDRLSPSPPAGFVPLKKEPQS